VIEAHRGFRLKDQKEPKNKSKVASQSSITAMKGGRTDAKVSLAMSALGSVLTVSRMKPSLDIEFSCALLRKVRYV
jgi:hypothetical protein